MLNYKKVIYISHPYGGKKGNKEDVENIVRELVRKYPDYLFVSPIHTFGYLYDTVDYQDGLNYCLWLLGKCDEMWVYGDWKNSRGCKIEIEACKEAGIQYLFKDRNEI